MMRPSGKTRGGAAPSAHEINEQPGLTRFATWFGSLSYVAAVLLGIFTPNDILHRSPEAAELVAWMASWNPQVASLGEMALPTAAANQFLYSVLWCAMPVYWLFFVIYYVLRNKHDFHFAFASRAHFWIAQFVAIPMVYLMMNIGGDGTDRIGAGLFGALINRSVFAPLLVFTVGLIVFLFILNWVALAMGRITYKK
jgi:hypothetical protein